MCAPPTFLFSLSRCSCVPILYKHMLSPVIERFFVSLICLYPHLCIHDLDVEAVGIRESECMKNIGQRKRWYEGR